VAAPIDFYFDFSSPYGYLAATRIDALAARHGRTVAWRPTLLGAVFKLTGMQPLTGIPLKGEYARRDMIRTARWLEVPFRLPTRFPISTLAPVRAYYWLAARDAIRAHDFALAIYRAYFVDDRDISSPDTVAAIAETLGVARAELAVALNDATVKERAKQEVDAAIGKGVFGSPYVIADGEPFWGVDRFDQLERWLATGGW
jgi:2-hydroxychromene-2-carboxylate isomerase